MKKTLAALVALAMASVASAATVLTLDAAALKANNGVYTDTADTVQTSGYGNYSMTLVLDAQKFINAVTADPFSVTNILKVDAAHDIGLSIKSDSRYGTGLYGTWEETATLYAFWTDTNGAVGAETSHLTEYLATAGTTYTDVAVTYVLNSAGAATYLTLVDAAGTATTLYGINGSLKGSGCGDVAALSYNTELVKHIVVDDSVLDATAAAAANKGAITAAAVPEPTTAALSLLALAGLAARRRRK